MLQSCGIIPYRYNNNDEIEFFVGHPGHHFWKGKNFWLFIKGHREKDEECLFTAKREFKEETGISLEGVPDSEFIYLGETQQSQYKKSVAYGVRMDDIDPDKCVSGFDENGEVEIDAYKWIGFDELMRCTHASHWQFYQALRDMASFKLYEDNLNNENDEEILDDSGY